MVKEDVVEVTVAACTHQTLLRWGLQGAAPSAGLAANGCREECHTSRQGSAMEIMSVRIEDTPSSSTLEGRRVLELESQHRVAASLVQRVPGHGPLLTTPPGQGRERHQCSPWKQLSAPRRDGLASPGAGGLVTPYCDEGCSVLRVWCCLSSTTPRPSAVSTPALPPLLPLVFNHSAPLNPHLPPTLTFTKVLLESLGESHREV
ncbi:hypothetical protein E2C01_048965 [Portunus trituberculatus]|uniref:Uncharacterized protein n=1 Tax=Portunus trituberculatus TaxID=210409 RepID=A0A5B7GER4_PORTR|nr:hypothetical protein [Portunus trituberculatus]